MPVPDYAPRRSPEVRLRLAQDRVFARVVSERMRRLRGDGEAGEGVPVDPTRPGTLDGGAAAALSFDD